MSQKTLNTLLKMNSKFAYGNHLLNVICFSLSQSDQIKCHGTIFYINYSRRNKFAISEMQNLLRFIFPYAKVPRLDPKPENEK
jgi:hypothetical protein